MPTNLGPSVSEVAAELACQTSDLPVLGGDEAYDLRLQVLEDGTWGVHVGDPSFDLDHHGYWGSASCLGPLAKDESIELASDLIDQANEARAEAESIARRMSVAELARLDALYPTQCLAEAALATASSRQRAGIAQLLAVRGDGSWTSEDFARARECLVRGNRAPKTPRRVSVAELARLDELYPTRLMAETALAIASERQLVGLAQLLAERGDRSGPSAVFAAERARIRRAARVYCGERLVPVRLVSGRSRPRLMGDTIVVGVDWRSSNG